MARGEGRVYRPVTRGKASPTWWIGYWYRGREVRESSGSTRESVARRMLRDRLSDKDRGHAFVPRGERTTFEDLAAMLKQDYVVNERRSLDRALRAIEHLRGFFGHDRAIEITADRITAYAARRREEPSKPGSKQFVKPATIRNELAALKRMFSLAVRAGKLPVRPAFPVIRVENARTGFFEDEQFRRVLGHLPEALRPAAVFAFYTGWRRGEVFGLQWSQIDLKAGVVRLEPGTTKNGEGRTFPFDVLPELASMLRQQRAATDAFQRETRRIVPWVFHRRGEPIRSFHHAWRRACRDAGVPGRLFHDFRRTAVRNLERASVPRSVAMKLVGHKTESIYRRYAIVAESDLREGVEKLAANRIGRPAAEAVGG